MAKKTTRRRTAPRNNAKKTRRRTRGASKPTARGRAGGAARAPKMVYYFGATKTEGKASQKMLLGGKGANLADMTSIGLPVPAGFTITTESCAARACTCAPIAMAATVRAEGARQVARADTRPCARGCLGCRRVIRTLPGSTTVSASVI